MRWHNRDSARRGGRARFKAHAWRACVLEREPGVQIPPSPPRQNSGLQGFSPVIQGWGRYAPRSDGTRCVGFPPPAQPCFSREPSAPISSGDGCRASAWTAPVTSRLDTAPRAPICFPASDSRAVCLPTPPGSWRLNASFCAEPARKPARIDGVTTVHSRLIPQMIALSGTPPSTSRKALPQRAGVPGSPRSSFPIASRSRDSLSS